MEEAAAEIDLTEDRLHELIDRVRNGGGRRAIAGTGNGRARRDANSGHRTDPERSESRRSPSELPDPFAAVSFPHGFSHRRARPLRDRGLLELRGENLQVARVRSAAKAVLALNTDDLAPLYRSGELAKLRGLGPSTLAVVGDLIENGESRYLEQLRQNVPKACVELMRVPGLGAAKIQQIHEALGIATLDELEAAARDGRLAKRAGFGEKTATRLLEAIAFMRAHERARALSARRRRSRAPARAVRRHPDVTTAEIAGSVRRRSEIVGDVDIVAAVRGRPGAVAASFARVPASRDATVTGGSAVHPLRRWHAARPALRARARRSPSRSWRATGSETHVAQMTDAARRARASRSTATACATHAASALPLADEPALYALLGLAFVPPEMREGVGEIDAAAARRFRGS